ncbi:MAG: hypothetical protein SOT67_06005 [Bacteroidaceae bacterium]|nr:hypothetical protein [Prevotellaceae bacterium]MDY2849800.1 hypothetical protein [Bacteroidaceae bacterium]
MDVDFGRKKFVSTSRCGFSASLFCGGKVFCGVMMFRSGAVWLSVCLMGRRGHGATFVFFA